MKAAVVYGADDIRIEEYDDPVAGPGEDDEAVELVIAARVLAYDMQVEIDLGGRRLADQREKPGRHQPEQARAPQHHKPVKILYMFDIDKYSTPDYHQHNRTAMTFFL